MTDSEDENWDEVWEDSKAGTSSTHSTVAKSSLAHSTIAHSTPTHSSSTSAPAQAIPPPKPSDGMMSRMVLNDNKAGMEGLDREKINAIIYEASKGSKYFENERKKEAQMEKRIAEHQQIIKSLSADDIKQGEKEADTLLHSFESERDLSRSIVHVDMDMFYAAVEMRDKPELRDKPMAVGGNSMLSTSNYAARWYGVRAAMPGFIARKLCPALVIVPPDFPAYTAASNQVRAVLAEYDPEYASVGLDEAYLDLTRRHLGEREGSSREERMFPRVVGGGRSGEGDGRGRGREGDGGGRGREGSKGRSVCCCSLAVWKGTGWRGDDGGGGGDGDGGGGDGEAGGRGEHVRGSLQVEGANVKGEGGERGGGGDRIQEDKIEGRKRRGDSFKREEGDSEEGKGRQEEDTDIPKVNAAETDVPDIPDVTCPKCGCKRERVEGWEEFGRGVEEAVREMRWRIQQRTGLTASAGIAPNMMLAKVCSDKNKPNGQYRIEASRTAVQAFMEELPIRKVSGFGKVSCALLAGALGVVRCRDLYDRRGALYHLYGTSASLSSFRHFLRVCLGLGATEVQRHDERKSISVERTFREVNEPSELYKKCRELSESLAEDMQAEHIVGKTVAIKIKKVTFEVVTRASSVRDYTDDAEVIFTTARELLRTEILACAPAKLRLRLMGVRMSNLLGKSQASKQQQKNIVSLFSKMKSKNQTLGAEKTIAASPHVDSTVTATTQTMDEENRDSSNVYVCPACNQNISDCLETFNAHLDGCVYISPTCSADKQGHSSGDHLREENGAFEQSRQGTQSVGEETKGSGSMISHLKPQQCLFSHSPKKPTATNSPSKLQPSVSSHHSKTLQPATNDPSYLQPGSSSHRSKTPTNEPSKLQACSLSHSSNKPMAIITPSEPCSSHSSDNPTAELQSEKEKDGVQREKEKDGVQREKEKDGVQREKEKDGGEDKESSSGDVVPCPLCARTFEGLVKLNHHLDQCLSKGAIKRCQQELRLEAPLAKKARKSGNTIDSFFKKRT